MAMQILEELGIRVGDILVIVSMIGTAIGVLRKHDKDESHRDFVMQRLNDDIVEMKKDIKDHGKALSDISSQKLQIDLLMKWYDEIRRGVGIVIEPDGR